MNYLEAKKAHTKLNETYSSLSESEKLLIEAVN